jgi:hypothetical protein
MIDRDTAGKRKVAPFARGAQPAAMELLSEKRPQASFSNRLAESTI